MENGKDIWRGFGFTVSILKKKLQITFQKLYEFDQKTKIYDGGTEKSSHFLIDKQIQNP